MPRASSCLGTGSKNLQLTAISYYYLIILFNSYFYVFILIRIVYIAGTSKTKWIETQLPTRSRSSEIIRASISRKERLRGTICTSKRSEVVGLTWASKVASRRCAYSFRVLLFFVVIRYAYHLYLRSAQESGCQCRPMNKNQR